MSIEKEIQKAFKFAVNYVKQKSPIDTGNLRRNAIKMKSYGNKFVIYVDEKIAPYMKYTNEPWSKGENPNQGWWDAVIEDVIKTMAIYFNGDLEVK